MKHKSQLCVVRMEILSTFHTRVEYISRWTIRHSANSSEWGSKFRIIVAKTTSDFNSDCTIRQYAHGLLLDSPFLPSSTDCWALWAKIRQNAILVAVEAKPVASPKNQFFDPGFLFAPSDSFYHAMHYSAKHSPAITYRLSVCLSVCLSVTLVDHDHIGWKSWKLIARTISPTSSLFVAQRSSTYSQRNMEKFWGD